MKRAEIEQWVSREPEATLLASGELDHVVGCLQGILDWYNEGRPLGHFLTAVLKNDFMEACGSADDVNRKVLPLYAKFLYNKLPLDYKQKIKASG